MANSGSLDASQFNNSSALAHLKKDQESLGTKQEQLELGAKTENVNKEEINAIVTDLTTIRDYLEKMQDEITTVISVEGSKKLEILVDAIKNLNDTIKELLVAVRLCKRLEKLEDKFGEKESDDFRTTSSHLFEGINKCRPWLKSAEKKIGELCVLLTNEQATTDEITSPTTIDNSIASM